jgi:hypothetical protein
VLCQRGNGLSGTVGENIFKESILANGLQLRKIQNGIRNNSKENVRWHLMQIRPEAIN